MTELNLDHPAVEAAASSYARTSPARTDTLEDMSAARREQFLRRAHQALTTAQPHLTAATEENLARLRNTEAGQQLLREGQEQGWSECADHVALHAVGLGHTMLSKNPYRMEEK